MTMLREKGKQGSVTRGNTGEGDEIVVYWEALI